jgi:hypothetical protein
MTISSTREMLTPQVQTCICHTVEFVLFLFPLPLKSPRHRWRAHQPSQSQRARRITAVHRSTAQPHLPSRGPGPPSTGPTSPPGPHESDRLTDTSTPHVTCPTCHSLHRPASRVRHTRPHPRTPTRRRSGASAYLNAHLSGEFRPTTQKAKTRSSPHIKKKKKRKRKENPRSQQQKEEEGVSSRVFLACASRLRACVRSTQRCARALAPPRSDGLHALPREYPAPSFLSSIRSRSVAIRARCGVDPCGLWELFGSASARSGCGTSWRAAVPG